MACIYRRRLLDIQMIVVIVDIPIGKMPTNSCPSPLGNCLKNNFIM